MAVNQNDYLDSKSCECKKYYFCSISIKTLYHQMISKADDFKTV